MRHYAALGMSYEWHPLVQHSATAISNLHDASTLLQTQLTLGVSERAQVDVGLLLSLGSRGEEYGPVEVFRSFTSGGAQRVYLRWVYHL